MAKNKQLTENPDSGGNSRLDAIYARIGNLMSLKDEIMGGLEEFVDDVDTKSVQGAIQLPEQFDRVVDAVVGDARAKATDNVARQDRKEEFDLQNTFYSHN